MNILANIFSLINLLFGFASIVFSSIGNIGYGASLVLLAMVADMLDGRMARLSRKNNAMGKELDSLADMVSFGIAPSILFLSRVFIYSRDPILENIYLPIMLAFIFPLTAAIRLARFNVMNNTEEYIGIPSPVAAGFISSVIGISYFPTIIKSEYINNLLSQEYFIIFIYILLSILMIVNIKFTKPTKYFLTVQAIKSLPIMLINIVIVVFLIICLGYTLIIAGIIYILSGVVNAIKR